MMERKTKVRLADELLALPAGQEVSEALAGLVFSPAARNRFVPMLHGLAGQETSGRALTGRISEAIDRFAKTTKDPTYTGYMLISQLPDYLRIFITDEEIFDDTLWLLEQEMAAHEEQESEYEPSFRPETGRAPGLESPPRDIKTALRTAPEARTPKQRERVKRYWSWLGRQGLEQFGAPSPHHVKQPSQRELARLHARPKPAQNK
jgi:hypothetical protein